MDYTKRHFLAGALWGAGLALFALYVLSHAASITLEGWPRISLGVVGLVFWLAGAWYARSSRSTVRADAELSAAAGKK